MVVQVTGLWKLVWGQPYIDAAALACAVEVQAGVLELDYRTRLLIRDSVEALRTYWGEERWQQWLTLSPARQQIESICREPFAEVGFPTISERLMDSLNPDDVREVFRELSTHISKPLRLLVGGSIALILAGYLSRGTEDIDVVDEVPGELRNNHQLINSLKTRYGLLLTHFQSHYLPSGWDQRVHFFESFGLLDVYLVDVHDIFLGKLTSSRDKDISDLRLLAPCLDKSILIERLKSTMASTFAEPTLRDRAEKNWYVLFGESLPYDPDSTASA